MKLSESKLNKGYHSLTHLFLLSFDHFSDLVTQFSVSKYSLVLFFILLFISLSLHDSVRYRSVLPNLFFVDERKNMQSVLRIGITIQPPMIRAKLFHLWRKFRIESSF